MDSKITLVKILTKAKAYVFLFSILIIGSLSTTFYVNNFIKDKMYESSTQILLNTENAENEQIQNEGLRTNIQLINTVSPIIKSRRVLSDVKEKLNLVESVSQLQQSMELSSGENSLVFMIRVKNINSEKAKAIANETAKVVANDIPRLFKNTKVIILEEASQSTEVHNQKSYVIAGITGVIICLIVLFISVFFDTMVRSKKQIEDLGLVYLGDIPKVSILDEGDKRE